MIFAIAFLIVVFCGIPLVVIVKKNVRLKGKILHLEKELEIRDSRLNYQKEMYSGSANFLFSSEATIMEMMQEIEGALKCEEGELPKKILEIAFEKTKVLLKPEKCALFAIDAEQDSPACLYSFGYTQEQLQGLAHGLDEHNSFLGWSIKTGRFLSFDDAQQDSLLSHLIERDPLKCHYSQPLKVDNKVKAVLCVGALSQLLEKNIITRFFSIVSNITSVALSNAFLTQELRELSVRDSLTGLYNHSYFQKWLENSLDKLSLQDNVLSLALVDLDYFKSVNDTYGHQTGDIVLKHISGLLNNLKARDFICARYGGEEFALVFMGQDIRESFAVMEDIRKKIAEGAVEIRDARIRVAISAGLAQARFSQAKKISKKDLIESADRALYQAKSEGRNRVICSSS